MIKLSVLLASYCGEATLPKTLNALETQEAIGFSVEYILVDNNSTDKTRQIFDNFLSRNPGIAIFEPKPGRSNALNSALSLATGDVVIFTDDDIIADERWLNAFAKHFSDSPNAVIACGQIRAAWMSAPPDWLIELEKSGRTLGSTPIDRPSGPVNPADIKGANFAIRRDAIQRTSVFRTDLGVSSVGAGIAGEETELANSLAEHGHFPFYLKDALVHHLIRPHQTTLGYILSRARRNGRGEGAYSGPLPPSRFQIAGVPAYAFVQMSRWFISGWLRFFRWRDSQSVQLLIKANEMWGFLQVQGRRRKHSSK